KINIMKKLQEEKLIAVIRGQTKEEATGIIDAAISGGLKVFEVTHTTPKATEIIMEIKDKGIIIGAGTVLDQETASMSINAGAEFIVSPHFDLGISKLCNRYSIPYLPGCMTITEMVKALESGVDIVKLFPTNNLNPSIIKSIKGPLPHIEIMPTGGINLENFIDYLKEGAYAVGIGSELTKAYQNGGKQAVLL